MTNTTKRIKLSTACIDVIKQSGITLHFKPKNSRDINDNRPTRQNLPLKAYCKPIRLLQAIVKHNGMSIRVLENHSHAIAMAAVMQDGLALKYVKTQTVELVQAALNQNPCAAAYVSLACYR